MKKFTGKVLIVSLLTSSLLAKVDSSLVKEYMEVSGANISLESMSQKIKTGITQRDRVFGKESDKKLLKLFDEAFEPNESVEIVQNYLQNHLNAVVAKKAIEFYNSPVGRKLVEASNSLSNESVQAKSLHFFADLQNNPPSKERVRVINELIRTTKLDIVVKDVFGETIYFLNRIAPTNNRVDEERLGEFISIMSSKMDEQIFLSTLFTYRDLNNKELKEVIKFYKTKAGELERDIVIDATKRMVRKGFIRAFKRLKSQNI
jgi:hypothetical protein